MAFEIAFEKTQALKNSIDALIGEEFPIETFQDAQITKTKKANTKIAKKNLKKSKV